MKNKTPSFAALLLLGTTVAFSNTPLLEDTGFLLSSEETPWISGANTFLPKTTWAGFDLLDAPTQVVPSGQGFVFSSYDDNESDYIETYVFQEYKASPYAGSFGPTEFKTGDVIVFKGTASATRSGNDPSDMKVRAFIKTLGWVNNMSHQILPEYSAFHDIGSTEEPFDISITFPDVVVMDNPQLVQIGFEISTEFDGTAMDSGTIYFENIEAYIEGTTWAGHDVDENGWTETGALGQVNVMHAPWVYVRKTGTYVYINENAYDANGGWVFVVAP